MCGQKKRHLTPLNYPRLLDLVFECHGRQHPRPYEVVDEVQELHTFQIIFEGGIRIWSKLKTLKIEEKHKDTDCVITLVHRIGRQIQLSGFVQHKHVSLFISSIIYNTK